MALSATGGPRYMVVALPVRWTPLRVPSFWSMEPAPVAVNGGGEANVRDYSAVYTLIRGSWSRRRGPEGKAAARHGELPPGPRTGRRCRRGHSTTGWARTWRTTAPATTPPVAGMLSGDMHARWDIRPDAEAGEVRARREAIARELFLVARLDARDWPAIDPPGQRASGSGRRDIDDRWPWYGRDLAAVQGGIPRTRPAPRRASHPGGAAGHGVDGGAGLRRLPAGRRTGHRAGVGGAGHAGCA